MDATEDQKKPGMFRRMSDWNERTKAKNAERVARGEERLARMQEKLAADAAPVKVSAHNAKFNGHKISGGMYYYPGGAAHVGGATAEFESGAEKKRMTGTRVISGGVLFGPAGAIVGGMLKKNKSKCYVTVTLATGDVAIIEAPIKEESEARKFAAKVNAAGAQLATYN